MKKNKNSEINTKREAIKSDLMSFLEKSAIKGKVFEDTVEDYMAFWDIKEMLIKDIIEHGVKDTYKNSESQYGEKINPSIDKLKIVSQQLQKIRQEIGMTAEKVTEEDIDEL